MVARGGMERRLRLLALRASVAAARLGGTTDTRIFRTSVGALRRYYSVSYRDVRCVDCSTVHNDAQLIRANITHLSLCYPAYKGSNDNRHNTHADDNQPSFSTGVADL